MICELCQCEESYDFHHLIPRTLHSNKWFKKRYSREEMQQGLQLCKACHQEIHTQVPSAKELGKSFNTREKLLQHPQLAGFVQWKQSKARLET